MNEIEEKNRYLFTLTSVQTPQFLRNGRVRVKFNFSDSGALGPGVEYQIARNEKKMQLCYLLPEDKMLRKERELYDYIIIYNFQK